MSKGLYLTAGFVLGALAGSAGTWLYWKKKYEDQANEDLAARRKAAAEERQEEKKSEEPVGDKQTNETIRAQINKPNIMEYAKKLNDEGYTNYSGSEEPKTVSKMEPDDEPYVIPPETFEEGESLGYEQISMTYYADGVVADDGDYILEDVERTLGDFADHYGDYEDDVVYVRNEAKLTDYEVCKDNRTYEEVSGKKPHRVEI